MPVFVKNPDDPGHVDLFPHGVITVTTRAGCGLLSDENP
jgi:hypothetical protein